MLSGFKQFEKIQGSAATDASCESVITTPQQSLRDANNPAGLLSIAEETLAEFLSKATGTAVDWVQMPGMKVSLERWLYEVAVERCWWKAKSLLKSIKMHSHSAITKEKDMPWC
ncbi:putative class III homeodomain-leucine zipper family [Helianthus annuus]|uniref:homeobox-leucine zipper protein REVOLUTA n=1 Tax=Helianthus annuus TaxID=4232 RepID=UPI00165304F4|nr:homeobox-leucine zipper protein REVOLUTA [Helianthus annuus]XP_035832375.1 homeobox-leucine zipper protein REVOLUTA [Helianthus annuus]KAJ0538037.1 putative class III homeodomain-leucine zipper family [Helianthus annuus]KAJ0552625.1 putative class III homeodomain-leucine zipper family [Helianthus annuus]